MINRTAIILEYKEPALRWINDCDETGHVMSMDDLADENNVYLVHSDEAEYLDDLEVWISLNFGMMFEIELSGWYHESLWPKELSFALFKQWFEVRRHSTVIDTSQRPILRDENI